MNRIHPIEYYDKELNIIGIYKLAKKVVDMKVKEAPWANFKNKNMHKYNYLRIHMYTTIGMIFYIISLMFINYLKKY